MKAAVWVLSILVAVAIGVGIYIGVQVNNAETDRKIADCQEGLSPLDTAYHLCAVRNGR